MKRLIDKDIQIEIFSPEDNIEKLIEDNPSITQCPKKSLEEFYYDNIKYLICTGLDKLPTKLKTNMMYLIFSMLESEYNHAYYYFEKEEVILYLDKDRDIEQRIYASFESIADDENPAENYHSYAETYFGGEAITEIDESPAEIKKQYGRKYTKEIAIFGVLFVIIGVMGYYLYADMTKVVRTTVPKPIVNPLTEQEKFKIENSLSLKFLKRIKEEVKKYSDEPDLLKKTRISAFSMLPFTEIQQKEPMYDKDENKWYYTSPHDEQFKRGGYEGKAIIVFQSIYPGVGYKLESEKEKLWKKDESVKIESSIHDVPKKNLNKKVSVTEDCLYRTLTLSENLIPFKRDNSTIEIVVREIAPSTLLERSLKLMKECPVYLTNFNLENGVFNMKATLKNIDKPKNKKK